MPTVEEIHQAPHNIGGWVLFIEGVPYAWTDIRGIAGSGVGSWIGVDERTVLQGLVVPAEIDLGRTDPWRAELVQSQPLVFGINDLTGQDLVVDVFKAFEQDSKTDSMGSPLSPLQDPAPEFGAGQAQTPIPLWSRHIGTEAIGPAGERRYLFPMPEGAPPGFDHIAGIGWPPSLVTEQATIFAGRWWALYRVVQDPETKTYPGWLEQHQGGSLISYGKIKGRGAWANTSSGRTFQMACFGPTSLLRKSINLSRPSRWHGVQGGISITGDRAKVAAWIANVPRRKISEGGIAVVPSTYECQTLLSGNTLDGLTTRAEIVERLNQIVQCMITGLDQGPVLGATNAIWTGPNLAAQLPWRDLNGDRDVYITPDGSTIRIKCEDPTFNVDEGYSIGIALDATVWQLLGWDINRFTRNAGVCPVGGSLWGEQPGEAAMPPFHYVAEFSTRSDQSDPPDQWSNGGLWQVYTAPYQAGTVTLQPEGGDELRLGVGVVRSASQYQQAYNPGAQIDGEDVNASGWWMFRGERITAQAFERGEDPEPYTQIAFCEWVATPGREGVEIDGAGYARLRTIRWEDPRIFGLEDERMQEPWVSVLGGLECTPLGVLGALGLPSAPGWRQRTIPSMLVSTGTATWEDTGVSVTITPGANHPPGLSPQDPFPGDVMAADLGCGIPQTLVDVESWGLALSSLPGGTAKALNRTLYGVLGTDKMERVLRMLHAGAGIGWSLRRVNGLPTFGAYNPLGALGPADAELVITRGDLAEAEIREESQWTAVVELRDGGPYDVFEISVDGAPGERGTNYEQSLESQDYARPYRDGRMSWPIIDEGLRDPTPWLGTPQAELFDWIGAARTRFAAGFGPYYARQRRIYRANVDARMMTRIGIGTIVRVIDPTAESPDGTRGIDHMGRVLHPVILTDGNMGQAVRVAIELEAEGVGDAKIWSPSAQGGVGSWDGDTSTLTLTENWSEVPGDHRDVAHFVQPTWDVGVHDPGPLRVAIYQSENGRDYPAFAEARADVIAVDEGTNTMTLGNISGRIFRDRIKWVVAAPTDEQTAPWAQELFIPVTESDGTAAGQPGGRL